jgi:hypothetical protein
MSETHVVSALRSAAQAARALTSRPGLWRLRHNTGYFPFLARLSTVSVQEVPALQRFFEQFPMQN